MKKIISIVVLSVFALSAVFAAATTAPVSTKDAFDNAPDSQVEVSLTVDPTAMNTYSFGFASEIGTEDLSNTDPNVLPAPHSGSLALVYDPATSTAKNADGSLYFYYKVRNNGTLSLYLSIDGPMQPDKEVDPLKWYVKGDSTAVTGTVTSAEQTVSIDLNSENAKSATISIANPGATTSLKYASCKLNVTTDPVPALAATTKYTGHLTLSVTSK